MQQVGKQLAGFSVWAVLFGLALLLAGCGQVITLVPTATPLPTPTIGLVVAAATLPPTSTPAPYTPEPTLTPTTTPTPIVHTIVSGDSLLSVATQYAVSVAALQDANGILDPRSLQIGQTIIIPRPEEVVEGVTNDTTPAPTPLPVTVQNIYLNETAIGGLWVLGEVQNSSGVPLEQVRIAVVLVDAQGNTIAQTDGLVALDLLDVNERSPFAVLFGDTPGKFEQYRAFPLHAVAAYMGSYYRDLEVVNLQSEGERYAAYTVTGLVRNTGPEEAVQSQVVLTAYDALGRVIAMRKIEPEYNVVPRGGETNFTALLVPIGGPVTRIEAVAQGRRLSAVK